MLRGFHHFSRIQMLLDFIDNAASCWVCANKTKKKKYQSQKVLRVWDLTRFMVFKIDTFFLLDRETAIEG